HGLLRVRFADLRVPAWYTGAGDGVLQVAQLASVALGFDVTGRSGERVLVDSLAYWYAIDPAIARPIARRDWPSLMQPWGRIDDEPAVDPRDRIARHDLYLNGPTAFRLAWDGTALWEPCTPDVPNSCYGLSIGFTVASRPNAVAYLADLRTRNPNLVVIAEI